MLWIIYRKMPAKCYTTIFMVNMIIEGPSIKRQSQLINAADKATAYSISELMIFHIVKNCTKHKFFC